LKDGIVKEEDCHVSPVALSCQVDGFKPPTTLRASPFLSLPIFSAASAKAMPRHHRGGLVAADRGGQQEVAKRLAARARAADGSRIIQGAITPGFGDHQGFPAPNLRQQVLEGRALRGGAFAVAPSSWNQ